MFQPPTPSVEIAALPADGYLLDVREEDEWRAGHAADAVHVPLSELMGRVDEIPADRNVYVICRSGNRSAYAASFLNQTGRTSMNVAGGMHAWEYAGLPMVSEDGDEPFVV